MKNKTKSIEEIDPNFKSSSIPVEDMEFFDLNQESFEYYGLVNPKEIGKFMRLPEKFLNSSVNDGVKSLLWHTSGGRLRFATDSPYIGIGVELKNFDGMPHMPLTGSSGFDLYTAERGNLEQAFKKMFFPQKAIEEKDRFYEGFYDFTGIDHFKEREITLHFPLYNGVENLHIGLKAGSKIFKPVKYRYENPVLYYGSSVTQGGCASRPGNNYCNHLSRWLHCDFINLGFSGSARGEIELAEYIATLKLSAFVMDYEANSPSLSHLWNTHYPFYQTIREKQPDLPIIMISFPQYPISPTIRKPVARDPFEARKIILTNYLRGLNEGDNNLYYVDGETLYGAKDQDACTMDYCHPNDLGFYRMAERIYPILKEALQIRQK